MSVMAMAAHTGCNTVYGSTAPNNPHPYPWMNSLFQDGVTVGWLMGESFIVDHARRSVHSRAAGRHPAHPRRQTCISEDAEYYHFTHFTDALMTDQEIVELPKVWVVGGDGGIGDIGYQNMSKVMLQNRPNVKVLMLDTQVYSNTGGQNSDSTPDARRQRHERLRLRHAGQEHREEDRRRDLPRRPRLAVRRAGFHGQRA